MVPTPNLVASSLLSGLNTYLVLGAAAAGLAFDVLRRGTVLRRLMGALTDFGGEPAGRLTGCASKLLPAAEALLRRAAVAFEVTMVLAGRLRPSTLAAVTAALFI